MSFVKLEPSVGDTRWINLHQLSRVTLGEDESGTEVLIAVFADGHVEDRLQIRGTDEINREAICCFQRALNHHCVIE